MLATFTFVMAELVAGQVQVPSLPYQSASVSLGVSPLPPGSRDARLESDPVRAEPEDANAPAVAVGGGGGGEWRCEDENADDGPEHAHAVVPPGGVLTPGPIKPAMENPPADASLETE